MSIINDTIRQSDIYGISDEACGNVPQNHLTSYPSLRFGTYPYEADGTRQHIEWIILKRQETKALLITGYGIDAAPFHNNGIATWENCSLRQWLNNDFLANAFAPEERSAILPVNVPADRNPDYETPPGNATRDHVFLLSISEARDLFRSNKERIVTATPFAIKNGACVNEISGTSWWWLRSPGATPEDTAIVNLVGSVRTDGNNVAATYDCIRPAIWVDLKKT